jgi:hypothetical protein
VPVLLPHPSAAPDDIVVTAQAERYGTELLLRFDVTGAIDRVRVPPPAPAPQRLDELWRHTCFEAFVRPSRSPAYQELNLSPSGDWAYYHFDDHRAGMSRPNMTAPRDRLPEVRRRSPDAREPGPRDSALAGCTLGPGADCGDRD